MRDYAGFFANRVTYIWQFYGTYIVGLSVGAGLCVLFTLLANEVDTIQ